MPKEKEEEAQKEGAQVALGQGLSFLAIVTTEGRRRAAVELKGEASRNPSYLLHTKSGFQRAAGSPIKAYVQVPPDPSSSRRGFARPSADISLAGLSQYRVLWGNPASQTICLRDRGNRAWHSSARKQATLSREFQCTVKPSEAAI